MEKVVNLLRESQAMLEGHFLLSSGRHSDKYFQCAKLLQHPDMAKLAFEDAVKDITNDIKSGKIKVDIVVGPAMGGIIAAWEVTRQLQETIPGLCAIFTERDENGIMTVRRGFEIKQGQNVLIVEDVITTGKSSLECAAALEAAGAKVSALTCVVDRRASESNDIPWPFYPACKLEAKTWETSECDLCKQGIPVVKPGSRKI